MTAFQGTIQVEGSYSHIAQAQTIVYLAPGLTPHNDGVEVNVTLGGRASFRVFDKTGATKVTVTLSKQLSKSFWIRFVWNSLAPVFKDRYVMAYNDGVEDTNASWSVTPLRPWTMLEANYIGIRNGYGLPGGTWPMNGTLRKVLIEKSVNLKV